MVVPVDPGEFGFLAQPRSFGPDVLGTNPGLCGTANSVDRGRQPIVFGSLLERVHAALVDGGPTGAFCFDVNRQSQCLGYLMDLRD